MGPPGTSPEGGPGGSSDPIVLGPDSKLPGVVVAITSIEGGTGANGNFVPGNTLRVTFTVADSAGTPIPLVALAHAGILVSGPTSDYQRVIPFLDDVATAAARNANASYTYTFAAPLPATYAPPYNDSVAFGTDTGERTGQSLVSGTYTVGIEASRSFIANGKLLTDAGNATANFLIGNATALDTREVVAGASCNQCHERVQAHGGLRNNVAYCVTCHTAGAEDRNTFAIATELLASRSSSAS